MYIYDFTDFFQMGNQRIERIEEAHEIIKVLHVHQSASGAPWDSTDGPGGG